MHLRGRLLLLLSAALLASGLPARLRSQAFVTLSAGDSALIADVLVARYVRYVQGSPGCSSPLGCRHAIMVAGATRGFEALLLARTRALPASAPRSDESKLFIGLRLNAVRLRADTLVLDIDILSQDAHRRAWSEEHSWVLMLRDSAGRLGVSAERSRGFTDYELPPR